MKQQPYVRPQYQSELLDTSNFGRNQIDEVEENQYMQTEDMYTNKRPRLTRSKKRKYASQPRGSSKVKKNRGEALPLVMELPLTRIKESQPKMATFYHNNSSNKFPQNQI